MDWILTEKRKAAILDAMEQLKVVLEKEDVTYQEVLNAIDAINYANDALKFQ